MLRTTHENRSRSVGSKVPVSLLTGFFLLLTAVLVTGCGSGRISIDGYDDSVLSHKRVFLLLPSQNDLNIVDADAFAYSRGIAELAAPERLMGELKANLSPSLDALLDSNTVLEYSSQTVGATVPLLPKNDFKSDNPSSWNWDKIRQAAKTGNIDYLVVIREVTMANEKPADDLGRGKERIILSIMLVDPLNEKQLTYNEVEAQLKDPRRPIDTYQRIADAMTKKLPFHIKKK